MNGSIEEDIQLTGPEAKTISNNEILRVFSTDEHNGLSFSQVSERRKIYGLNEIPEEEEETLLMKFFDQFKDPMILMLLVSALVSLLLGQFSDALSIFLAISIVCTVAFIQEYRSDKAIEKLQELITHTASVIREGRTVKINTEEIVPGDLVVFSQGDRIPADLRIIQANKTVQINESLFTGETDGKTKTIECVENKIKRTNSQMLMGEAKRAASFHVSSCPNIAFMGTVVTTGSGKGVVICTGKKTQLGQISSIIKSIKETKTPLEKSMGILAKQVTYVSIGIIAVIVLLGIITKQGVLPMFQMGISLAVAAIPEGLPVVVTVTLGMGVLRMAKKKTIVRKLQSVETLGAVNVICSDKTGTLTRNEMTIKYIFCANQPDSFVKVTGGGYDENGKFYHVPIHRLNDCEGNEFEKVENHDLLDKLLVTGNICNKAEIENPHGHGLGKEKGIIGMPTEVAFLVAARKRKISEQRKKWKINNANSVEFSSEEKYMMTCGENKNGKVGLFAKGALEVILKKSMYNGNKSVVMSEDDRQKILDMAGKFEEKEMRVLGLAYTECDSMEEVKENAISLVFLGFVGMWDPPREEVKESIQKLKKNGIQIVMITGDSKKTALAIGKSLGIIDEFSKEKCFQTQEDIESDDFGQRVEEALIFYRTSPTHKMGIVEALQRKGYVVAMTGDGINDAPALKQADIGISMGESGCDVAKESSDMILVDDNFATLIPAIEEGKSIWNNIKNFLRYQLTTSVVAMGLIIFSTVLGYPLPLNPMQILYVNLLMDGAPAQSLGVEPADPDVMKKPPRKIKSSPITGSMIFSIIVNSAIMLVGSLSIFLKEFAFDDKVDARDTTMVFATFVMLQMFNAMNCRSDKKSCFQLGIFKNKALVVAMTFSIVGLFLLCYFPLLQKIFDTVPLYFIDWILVLLISSSVLVFEETLKYLRKKFNY